MSTITYSPQKSVQEIITANKNRMVEAKMRTQFAEAAEEVMADVLQAGFAATNNGTRMQFTTLSKKSYWHGK